MGLGIMQTNIWNIYLMEVMDSEEGPKGHFRKASKNKYNYIVKYIISLFLFKIKNLSSSK